ncbi:hypothetical protein G9A89_010864 [Geosiphon pyriformis]|nr:hypothetical protein G9A89_010864 [Geosiphon pyriformis]
MQSVRNAIDISSSSVVDLKAELFKQKEEFKKQKAAAGDKPIIAASRLQGKKQDIWTRQNKGVSDRSKRDMALMGELEKPTLEASRLALQRKAKLYDRLKKTGIEDEKLAEEILVDFDRKISEQPFDNDLDTEENDDDPWVEYIDEYGRTRVTRKSQVPKELSPPPKSLAGDGDGDGDEQPTMMSKDMYMEQERRRWEEEALAEINNGPLHYDETKEIRTKGVGFYRFSKNEEERQEQMSALKEMRYETEQKRSLRKNIKDKRKSQLEARMAFIRKKKLKTLEIDSETSLTSLEITAEKILNSPIGNLAEDAVQDDTNNNEERTYNESSVSDLLTSIRRQIHLSMTQYCWDCERVSTCGLWPMVLSVVNFS